MRIGFGSNLRIRIGYQVAAAQADIGADGGEDAAKRIGPFPRRGERAIAPLLSADGAIVAVCERLIARPSRGLLRSTRQQFLEQKPGVVIAKAVVFVAAVKSIQRRLAVGRLTMPGSMKTPMVIGISLRSIKLLKTLGA